MWTLTWCDFLCGMHAKILFFQLDLAVNRNDFLLLHDCNQRSKVWSWSPVWTVIFVALLCDFCGVSSWTKFLDVMMVSPLSSHRISFLLYSQHCTASVWTSSWFRFAFVFSLDRVSWIVFFGSSRSWLPTHWTLYCFLFDHHQAFRFASVFFGSCVSNTHVS